MSEFVDDGGRPIRLGPKIGQGGEGAVYRSASDPALAVKIYAKAMPADRVRKIKILASLDGGHLNRFIARPLSLVRDGSGRPRGLVAPLVEGGADVHNVYTPASRRTHFPSATWPFLLSVAANTARAFDAVHRASLVIGDVNPGSVMVLRDGTVRLIDVDSFQVPVTGAAPLLCTVAVPMFQPPELHGALLDRVVRTSDHDCFGLAVMLFHLLMLGRHPFAGRPLATGDMPIDRAVAEQRFVYGTNARHFDMAPPPNTVSLDILPPRLAAMFEAAFAPLPLRRRRPSAREWVQELESLGRSLTPCGASPAHHYWSGLHACPWCGLEQRANVTLFTTPPPRQAAVRRAEQEFRRLSDVLNSIRLPAETPPPRGGSIQIAARAEAEDARSAPLHARVLAVTGALTVAAGLALILYGGLLLVLLGIPFIFAGRQARNARRRPWVAQYEAAQSAFLSAAQEFDNRRAYPEVRRAHAQAQQARRAWTAIEDWRAQQFHMLETNKRRVQLRQHLEAHLIEDARIKGIGASRVASLSAFGIDTAWNVSAQQVQLVPGFGPTMTQRLVDWHRSVAATFAYRPNEPLPSQAVAALERQVEMRRRQALNDLVKAIAALRAAVDADPRAAADAGRRLVAAEATLAQASADFQAATGKWPS